MNTSSRADIQTFAKMVAFSLRGRRTKGREGGKLNASEKRDESAKRDRWALVGRSPNDRASRSHSTSPLPPLCTPATQAR